MCFEKWSTRQRRNICCYCSGVDFKVEKGKHKCGFMGCAFIKGRVGRVRESEEEVQCVWLQKYGLDLEIPQG